jgi:hypothetical protein
MMTVQEYVQRIPSKITWSRSLEGAGRDCKNLERLIEGAAPAKLRKRPAPEKWSAAEILAHLADAKIVVSWRLRSILGGLGTPIQAFATKAPGLPPGHCAKRDARKSLEQFRVLTLIWLFTRTSRIASMMAGHNVNHLE